MDSILFWTFLSVFLMYLVKESSSIRCYVCSSSPEDKNNRTDRCTEDNFRPEHVYVHECPLGCEVFIQYDANDVLEQWRRNCVRKGQTITGACKESKAIGWKKIWCTCDTDLCNNSPLTKPLHWLYATAAILLFHKTICRTLGY